MVDRRVFGRSRFTGACAAALGSAALLTLLGAKGCDSNYIGVQEYGSIQGNAVDQKGRPISGAIVYVGSLATIRSGPDGSFLLPHVPSGEQTVNASLGGYQTGSATIIVTKDKQVSAGNIVLTQLTWNP
jgi:hypothetical protein